MASALKRKRGQGEAAGVPKRAKPIKEANGKFVMPQLPLTSGWDAAFAPPAMKEIITSHGIKGDGIKSDEEFKLQEAMDYADYEQSMRNEEREMEAVMKKEQLEEGQRAKHERKLLKKVLSMSDSTWKLSEPIGGRQINVDPVFTEDEKYSERISSVEIG